MHEEDVLGKLALTDQGMFDRDYYVLRTCAALGVPVATVVGGEGGREGRREGGRVGGREGGWVGGWEGEREREREREEGREGERVRERKTDACVCVCARAYPGCWEGGAGGAGKRVWPHQEGLLAASPWRDKQDCAHGDNTVTTLDTHAGGYDKNHQLLAWRHSIVFQAAAAAKTWTPTPPTQAFEDATAVSGPRPGTPVLDIDS